MKTTIITKNILKIFKNISIIGFMGSGKSTTGIILAKRLDFLFLDLDRIIELYEEKKISEIFEKHGEEYFRDVESKIIEKVYGNTGCVFSCGGGVILRQDNIDIIRKNSFVVHLDASAAIVFSRLKSEDSRPLLKNEDKKEKITSLMKTRKRLYENNCDLSINSDEKTPEEITDGIIQKIKQLIDDRHLINK